VEWNLLNSIQSAFHLVTGIILSLLFIIVILLFIIVIYYLLLLFVTYYINAKKDRTMFVSLNGKYLELDICKLCLVS